MEIVTGSTGQVHVTPIDDAVRNGNYGYLNNKVVFTCYENLSARAITANQVRVFSGYGMNQGRLFKIDKNDYDNVTIENGSQGYKRADLIVARYTMNSQTGFEDISLEVIKGQSGSSYVDPSYTTGNINNGADFDDFPLYRVKINGLQIEAVEQMFTLVPDGGRLGVIENKINTNMKVNLASESTGNLDNCYGVSNLNLGVSGTLPVAHGGTGANSASGAAKNIVIDNLAADTGTMAETTEFITSESGGGFTTLLKKRTFANIWASIQTKIKSLLGMGSTEIVSVAHGGTGKASVTSGSVLVGNGTGAMSEKAVIGTLDGSDDIPTAKAVSDAMSEAGYGDMMKSTYTNQNDCISVSKGGTGTSDGTLNGVKLATSGTTKGYIDANGNFKSFRQPTGNASAAQVLKNYTFSNASSDGVTGSMENYSGNSRRTVTPTSGTGNETLSLSAGYHDSVIVNRTNPYNAGVAAAQAVTWAFNVSPKVGATSSSEMASLSTSPYVIDLTNVKSGTIGDGTHYIYYTYFNSAGTRITGGSTQSINLISGNQAIPSGAKYLSVGAGSALNIPISITYQAKILR